MTFNHQNIGSNPISLIFFSVKLYKQYLENRYAEIWKTGSV